MSETNLLWDHDRVLKEITGLTPRLESWNAKTDPAQVRLLAYLEDVRDRLGALPEGPLGLHLEVDVEYTSRLTHHYDLENYLTPLVRFLGRDRFHLATAHKKVGGGSSLRVATLGPRQVSPEGGWHGTGFVLFDNPSSPEFKATLREHLSQFAPLGPGPVQALLAWRAKPERNWVSFWKPTGDSMGPLLGEPFPDRPYYPNDDRIVSLEHHWLPHLQAGRSITVWLWWRSLGASELTTRAALPPVPRKRETVIDGLLEVACELGADEQPVALGDLFAAYVAAFPERAGQKEDSFSATLSYHCVNMRSRFPRPKEPTALAAWMSRPLFKGVRRGWYQLLSEADLAWFRRALAEGDERVFLPEYDLP